MLALLSEIRDRTAQENTFLGDAGVRALEQELASLPEIVGPSGRVLLMFELAKAQLKIGETKQAIAQFQKCFEIYSSGGDAGFGADVAEDELHLQMAIAYLRLAEDENCVHCRNGGASCILPIREDAVHQFRTGAEKAIQHLTAYLKRNPADLGASWLLNIAYMTLGEYPDRVPQQWRISPESFAIEEDFPRFENIGEKLGLDEISLSGGMVVEDLNGDGWLDVVTSTWDTAGQMRCYLSSGDGTFRETTAEAGLNGLLGGLNLIHADYDNDGDADILVLRGAWLHEAGCHPNSLLQNDGAGRFRDVTFETGLGNTHYPTQTAAWADYDNDGDLDLFVGNEIGSSELFENDGTGRFKNVAPQAGVADSGATKGCVWGDYDNDRYPDLFVANFFGPNHLYHNNRDGTFTDVASQVGVDLPERAFPTWFWDFNNDGALDLYVAAYWQQLEHFAKDFLGQSHEAETDYLFQGDGKGGFRDVSAETNLNHVTLPMGSNFGDLDNDGYLDFYLGTGFPDYEGLLPNRMFHNREGRGFSEVTTAGGFGHLQKGHGVAFADYDHDGDQDIFIEMGGAFRGDAFANAVFENPGFENHWISIKLIGGRSNRSAIGARIRAVVEEGGKTRSIYRWVNTGGSFGSSPLRQHVGLGQAVTISQLEIFWPTTGTTQRFHDVPADQLIEITEGTEQIRKLPVAATVPRPR